MHLPLKLAVSLPVTVAVIGGMVAGLASAEGRRVHPVYGLPEGLFLGFIAGVAALLLVLPNLAGGTIANRLGASSPLIFVPLLAGGVVATWHLQALLLQRWLRPMGTVDIGFDWKIIAVLAIDVLLLAGAAFWNGRAA